MAFLLSLVFLSIDAVVPPESTAVKGKSSAKTPKTTGKYAVSAILF